MLRVFIVAVALIAFLVVRATSAESDHPMKITIVRMEEPDLVREIKDSSLLRLVKKESLPEQGFKRVTIQRSDGTRFTWDFLALEKKDFALKDGDKIFLIYEL